MDIEGFWRAVLEQDEAAMAPYFAKNAYVNWHCTNERFTAAEFIRANCRYPGRWEGEVERVCQDGDVIITVTRVYAPEHGLSFHAVSFIKTQDNQILSIDEYWGDDGPPPQWRKEMGIGAPIVP